MSFRSVAAALVTSALLVPSLAYADDCPAGSKSKTEEGFTWCEPSVCMNDGNCSPSEVCRPVPLCVEVGKLDEQKSKKDAAQRLVATQRCAPDETCPSTQTCSKMNRCVSKAQAEKMGMASAPGASASAAPTEAPKKSACGCSVIGSPTSDLRILAGLALGLVAIGSRRIHRARREPPQTR
jgi:hypothetical protein